MNSIRLIAKNSKGEVAEFTLYGDQKQYSIGHQGDISLASLDANRSLYSPHAFITFIDGRWYVRSAKGHRTGKRAFKVNGKLVESSKPDILIRQGHRISFGKLDDIVISVEEDDRQETLKDVVPEIAGLLEHVLSEFESLNGDLRHFFRLNTEKSTVAIFDSLLKDGFLNEAYLYNLARGLRNIGAHSSRDFVRKLDRRYISEALRSMEMVRRSLRV
jgi:hypothetical protein